MEEMKPTQTTETATGSLPESPHDGMSSDGVSPSPLGAVQEEAHETAPVAKPAPPMDWRRFGLPVSLLLLFTVGLVIALQVMPRAQASKNEKTLHKVPTTIGDWNLYHEYEMDERARNELLPDEYLARIYVSPEGRQADLSIIGGSHTGAFHNPQVCFRVQNWEFVDNREIVLNPEVLNHPIKARAVQLLSLDGRKREAVGIYFYSTPMGYRSDTSSARILLLLGRLSGLPSRAYFVRFLMPTQGTSERDMEILKQFAEQTLSAMAKTNPEVVR